MVTQQDIANALATYDKYNISIQGLMKSFTTTIKGNSPNENHEVNDVKYLRSLANNGFPQEEGKKTNALIRITLILARTSPDSRLGQALATIRNGMSNDVYFNIAREIHKIDSKIFSALEGSTEEEFVNRLKWGWQHYKEKQSASASFISEEKIYELITAEDINKYNELLINDFISKKEQGKLTDKDIEEYANLMFDSLKIFKALGRLQATDIWKNLKENDLIKEVIWSFIEFPWAAEDFFEIFILLRNMMNGINNTKFDLAPLFQQVLERPHMTSAYKKALQNIKEEGVLEFYSWSQSEVEEIIKCALQVIHLSKSDISINTNILEVNQQKENGTLYKDKKNKTSGWWELTFWSAAKLAKAIKELKEKEVIVLLESNKIFSDKIKIRLIEAAYSAEEIAKALVLLKEKGVLEKLLNDRILNETALYSVIDYGECAWDFANCLVNLNAQEKLDAKTFTAILPREKVTGLVYKNLFLIKGNVIEIFNKLVNQTLAALSLTNQVLTQVGEEKDKLSLLEVECLFSIFNNGNKNLINDRVNEFMNNRAAYLLLLNKVSKTLTEIAKNSTYPIDHSTKLLELVGASRDLEDTSNNIKSYVENKALTLNEKERISLEFSSFSPS